METFFTSPEKLLSFSRCKVSGLLLLIVQVAELLVKKVNINFRIHNFVNLTINKGPHINFSRKYNEISQLL